MKAKKVKTNKKVITIVWFCTFRNLEKIQNGG